MLTVIGRGHSGTRVMSHTLTASGVYMGQSVNESGDLIPPEDMYEACRIVARYVTYRGNLEWDFTKLHTMQIDPEFIRLIQSYLTSVLNSGARHRGWKIPETTLVYPWLVRLFPGIHFIYWIRDPRDCILGQHLTDNLARFGVPCEHTDDVYLRRAISWKYQAEIVKATPPPKHFLTVSFERFVLEQDEELARLEAFLGFPLVKTQVRPGAVGRWRRLGGRCHFDIFDEDLIEHGYGPQGAITELVDKACDGVSAEALRQPNSYDSWLERLRKAEQEVAGLIPAKETVIWVDDEQVRFQIAVVHQTVPFLERDGQYWGRPPDDEIAIRECERLRRHGVNFLVFAWPAFWWLDYYKGFHDYLRSTFPCILQNERLVIFDLRAGFGQKEVVRSAEVKLG